MAPAGDQDGDGYADLMVAYSDGVVAQILPGGATTMDTATDALSQIVEDGEHTTAADMLGDIDGDGTLDLAVILDDADVLLFTELVDGSVQPTSSPYSTITFNGAVTFNYDTTNLGDLDGDGKNETLVHPQSVDGEPYPTVAVFFGSAFNLGATLRFADAPLHAVTFRDHSRYGYRASHSPDINGDGVRDVIIGGYIDPEIGHDAGGVALLATPQ